MFKDYGEGRGCFPETHTNSRQLGELGLFCTMFAFGGGPSHSHPYSSSPSSFPTPIPSPSNTPCRLAHRVQCHGQQDYWAQDGHPHGGRGPQVPTPRQRTGTGRGILPRRVSVLGGGGLEPRGLKCCSAPGGGGAGVHWTCVWVRHGARERGGGRGVGLGNGGGVGCWAGPGCLIGEHCEQACQLQQWHGLHLHASSAASCTPLLEPFPNIRSCMSTKIVSDFYTLLCADRVLQWLSSVGELLPAQWSPGD